MRQDNASLFRGMRSVTTRSISNLHRVLIEPVDQETAFAVDKAWLADAAAMQAVAPVGHAMNSSV